MVELPEYARINRSLPPGEYTYTKLLPRIVESPAMSRIATKLTPLDRLLELARVRLEVGEGYVWVDDEAPAIVLVHEYYRTGAPRDLYLDLLHELTHLRQLAEGIDIWDKRYHYVDRPTEIEGYSVAIEEGIRLGMNETAIMRHLANPWMTHAEVQRLRRSIDQFLAQNPYNP
jgi:hypothetical protein